MSSRAAWLVSTSTAICIGSSAGATFSTSRAMLSSRIDEVGGTEVRDRRARLVEHAHIHRSLERLGDERAGPRDRARGERQRGEQDASIGHEISIGLAFKERQAN